jgi:hypothetical protein
MSPEAKKRKLRRDELKEMVSYEAPRGTWEALLSPITAEDFVTEAGMFRTWAILNLRKYINPVKEKEKSCKKSKSSKK